MMIDSKKKSSGRVTIAELMTVACILGILIAVAAGRNKDRVVYQMVPPGTEQGGEYTCPNGSLHHKRQNIEKFVTDKFGNSIPCKPGGG